MAGAYNVTLTSDHRLLVNEQEPTPQGIAPGDSEALLTWALRKVTAFHQQGEGDTIVQVEDEREGGYGTLTVTLEEGNAVAIEDLREAVGHSFDSASVQPSFAPPAATVIETPKKQPKNTSARNSKRQSGKAERPRRKIRGSRRGGPRDTSSEAKDERTGATAVKTKGKRGSRSSAEGRRPEASWVKFDPVVPGPKSSVKTGSQGRSKGSLSTGKRVVVGAGVALAALVGVRAVQGGGSDSYVAVCVDNRTMVRQAADSNCKTNPTPSYYRWFYIPSGKTVPIVEATVDANMGSTMAPPNSATIEYGFDRDGGTVR